MFTWLSGCVLCAKEEFALFKLFQGAPYTLLFEPTSEQSSCFGFLHHGEQIGGQRLLDVCGSWRLLLSPPSHGKNREGAANQGISTD